MSRRKSVTIGIPAFNEAASLPTLLAVLQQQTQQFAKIAEIIVFSDGSTDATVAVAAAAAGRNIAIVRGKTRKGKPARINQIFARAKTEIVVILDADIRVSSQTLIDDLIEPFFKQPSLSLVSGRAKPARPKNAFGHIMLAGTSIWEFVKKQTSKQSIYYCEGRIRAFRKPLYTTLRFPQASADEAYSYLFAKYNGYQFYYQAAATVSYQLPQTIADYSRQMKRFLKSESIQAAYFPPQFVAEQYCATATMKLRALLLAALLDPFYTLCYCCCVLLPRFERLQSTTDQEGIWQISRSTKQIHYETA